MKNDEFVVLEKEFEVDGTTNTVDLYYALSTYQNGYWAGGSITIYFNPNKPTDPFPTYVNQIIHGNNRKLWAIMVEPDWKDQEDRNNYVQRIKDLSLQMSRRDKVLLLEK